MGEIALIFGFPLILSFTGLFCVVIGHRSGIIKERAANKQRSRVVSLERDRLKNRLHLFDLCKCGKRRFQHTDQWPACRGFRIDEYADDLETIVEDEPEKVHIGVDWSKGESFTAVYQPKNVAPEYREPFEIAPGVFPRYSCACVNSHDPGRCKGCGYDRVQTSGPIQGR